MPQPPYVWWKTACHLLNWRLVGLRAVLHMLGKKIYCPCHDLNPGLSRQWHSCSIYTQILWMWSILCFVWWPYSSCSEKHIEETAKKLTSFSFTFFKWLINFSFYFIYLVFQRSTKVDIELVKYNSHSTERVTTIKYTL